MSGLDLTLEPEPAVRRFEVLQGVGGRRRWSKDDKARILELTLAPGAVVSEIACRHGLTPQQLFTWRRQARHAAATDEPMFVPAITVPPAHVTPSKAHPEDRPDQTSGRLDLIEIEVNGAIVRVRPGTDATTLAMVLRAVRALP
ncbi:IS66-like element accessory protein TnpA [Microvirga arabica]|uniref:IS66-like element accessory protein TnpA n=1 Tax=Microvirga arabica TaxID=1128671 RepID=UPI0019395427|nr:transposase [Microvirga arabica]MBM1175479.1 transposase [Microvirga arabica]